MAFDGICLKAITTELKELIGYKIDKVYEPNKNNIVLGLYGERTKFALNICIDSKFYRIHLTTHSKPNPTASLSFCMLLRKHIIGYKIKNILTYGLERLLMFELEPFDTYENDIKYLIVELMGKHSNIILADKNKVIIDSIRHTNIANNSYRNIFPKQNYVLPNSDKLNIENIEVFEDFYDNIQPKLENTSLEKAIVNNYKGISSSQLKFIENKLGNSSSSKENVKLLFNKLKSVIKEADNNNLHFEEFDEKDFALSIGKLSNEPFSLNFFIDDYYYDKETASEFIIYRNNVLKLICDQQKKYSKRLQNINEKLQACDNKDEFKLYGELLTANLYKLNNQHLNEVEVLNYYSGKNIIIPLDIRFTVNENCKRFFKKYSKLKNALIVVAKQKEETKLQLNYIESIVFELDSAETLDDINIVYDEISENVLFKERIEKSNKGAKKKSKRSGASFNPLSFTIDGYTVLVGRNNKENDWLTTKYATATDLWFHTKDIHGSHVILKTGGNIDVDKNVLIECAKLAAKHSKGKLSANVPVDYTQVKFVKKPNGAKPGMVIYKHNKTLYVTPK